MIVTLLSQGDELFPWRVFLVNKDHRQVGEMDLMIVLLITDMMVPQGLAAYLGFFRCVLGDC